MGLIARIAQASGVQLRCIASLELVAFDDVERFLAVTAKYDVVVLGIEGFRVVAGRAEPDMDAIADFSSAPAMSRSASDSIREAERFVREVGEPTMFFEFVLGNSRHN